MNIIKTNDDVKRLGTILGVWAHPDDETFTMGGIMAAAVKNGQKVVCVTATRGEKGLQDEARWPATRLGQIRTDELEAAMKIIGVKEHCWLDYADGGCNQVNEDKAIKQIADHIIIYRPDSILTFGNDGLTGHPDHKCVSRWTKKALAATKSKAVLYTSVQTKEQYKAMSSLDKQFDVFFNIDKPPIRDPEQCGICLKLNDDEYDLKLSALKAMPSQYEAMLKAFEPSLRPSLGVEAFVEAKDD